jgi:hypothetical protein
VSLAGAAALAGLPILLILVLMVGLGWSAARAVAGVGGAWPLAMLLVRIR